ncbi:hypothetical protein D9C73_006110 [Collichthys lucidus]|uniref:Uncharacterized protein n=1 Tax=Collichthys lucidus TaxID=240159 RepID=A0A4U5UC43_COLLU|nr:hypothetical protein D9C73_006110 [Collichthys lucidus]
MLMLHKEADIAVAEAAALEEEAERESRKSVSDEVKRERTQEYVQSQIRSSEPQGPPLLPTNDNSSHSRETLLTCLIQSSDVISDFSCKRSTPIRHAVTIEDLVSAH